MYLLGIIAVGFYALKIPERWFPGKGINPISKVQNNFAYLLVYSTIIP